MGLPTLLILFVVAVIPFSQGTTPEYFSRMGQPMGIGGNQDGGGMYPNEDYTGGLSQGYGSSYGSSSGMYRFSSKQKFDMPQ